MFKKITALSGIGICCIYFFVAAAFIVVSSQCWLIAFDIVTMLSGIYFLFLILALSLKADGQKQIFKLLAIAFTGIFIVLTNLAHLTNIISLSLINCGVFIPDYLLIGKWPSITMRIEYLGWGIFLGMALLFSALCTQKAKTLKITLLICSALCIAGFFGALINENFWYIASMGYGPGTMAICILLLLYDHNERNFLQPK